MFIGKNKKLSNKRILLLEKKQNISYTIKPTFGKRVSTLNIATEKLLEKIGAWEYITRKAPIKYMQVNNIFQI